MQVGNHKSLVIINTIKYVVLQKHRPLLFIYRLVTRSSMHACIHTYSRLSLFLLLDHDISLHVASGVVYIC